MLDSDVIAYRASSSYMTPMSLLKGWLYDPDVIVFTMVVWLLQ